MNATALSPLLTSLTGLMLVMAVPAGADDWPQWRGPQRTGVSQERGLLGEWPKDGPKLLWEIQNCGAGFSTPAVVGERIYLLANEGIENEYVRALAVKDGQQVWSARIGKVGCPDQQPRFPAARSTPTVEGDWIYALGSDGDLVCLAKSSGEVRWKKNLQTDFGGRPGTWAYAESPLIDGQALICTPGGNEATLVAVNKTTGEVLWKCAVPGGGQAAYSSAILVETGGLKQYVQMLGKGLVGVGTDGKFLWRYDKTISKFNANIPTPVAKGAFIYSAGAGTGGGLVKLKTDAGAVTAEQISFSPKLPTAIGGSVILGDFMYGTAQSLLCVEFATGNVKWEDPALGAASICAADGRLYLHGENGQVALVEATPDRYSEKGRFTPPNLPKRSHNMEKAWSYPVVANGHLYIRDLDRLWCYDVKAR